MSDALRDALLLSAPGATLERRGTLAVLRVRDARSFADARVRADALAAAAADGATHLAIELLSDEATGDPSLPGD